MASSDVNATLDLTNWQLRGHGVQVAAGEGGTVVLRSLDAAANAALEHDIDPAPWRGKTVRFAAALQATEPQGYTGVAVRVHAEDGSVLSVDAAVGGDAAVAAVPADAARLVIGVERFGGGELSCSDFALAEAPDGATPGGTGLQVPLPSDATGPAADALRWLFAAVRGRAAGVTAAELEERMAEQARRRGLADFVVRAQRLALELHGATIVDVAARSPHRLRVDVRDATGRVRSFVVAVSASPPHRISSFQLLPFARGQRQRPQLTEQGKKSRNKLIRTVAGDAVRGIVKPFRKRSKDGIVISAGDRRAEVAAMTTKIGVRVATTQVRTRKADAAKREEAFESVAERSAQDVFKVMGSMKGAIMKIAQFASYTVDGMPQGMEQELSKLQQAAPPMDAALVKKVIAEQLGKPPEQAFAAFSPEPIAAASVGQVHRATTHDGVDVAVKVQYPGVEKAIRADLENAEMLMTSVSGMFGDGGDPKPVLEELVRRATEELDYRQEAQSQRFFADRYRDHRWVKVPQPVEELSTERVLTTEFVEGRRFYDLMSDSPEARNSTGEIVYRFAVTSVFRDGVFSGDPHPGNYVFMDDGRVCFLDFGMVKRLENDRERTLLTAPVEGLLTGRRDAVDESMLRELLALEDGDPPDGDAVWRYFSSLFGLVLSDLPVKFTRASVQEGMQRSYTIGTSGQPNRTQRRLGMAPLLGVFTRYVFGTHAVLGHLEAEANWHRMLREAVLGDEPSTEIGRTWT